MGDPAPPPVAPGATPIEREFSEFRWFLPDAFVEAELASLRVTYMNRMAFIVFGYTPADLAAGLTGAQLLAPREITRALEMIRERAATSRASGEPYERTGTQDLNEQLLLRKDGTAFWAETSSSFGLDQAGVPTLLRTLIRDISARRPTQTGDETPDAIEERPSERGRHLVAVCPGCQRLGDASGAWLDLHTYAHEVARARAYEPCCPDCRRRARKTIAAHA